MARIAFDLDGTLVDSAPDLHAMANELLAARGLAPITLDQARGFIGQGVSVFVAKLRAARGIPDSAQADMLAGYLARYETAVGLTTLYPHVRQTLTALLAQGHTLALCTNKPMAPTRALLHHLQMDMLFAKVVAGDSLPERKPHPAPLLDAFEIPGTGPNLYVGDSEVDAETAMAAQIPFLLFTQGYRATPVADLPHAAAFDDYTDLPSLIASLIASLT